MDKDAGNVRDAVERIPTARMEKRSSQPFDTLWAGSDDPAFAAGSYRFVPAGTAWYRLVPDKFFSPDLPVGHYSRLRCGFGVKSHHL